VDANNFSETKLPGAFVFEPGRPEDEHHFRRVSGDAEVCDPQDRGARYKRYDIP